MANVKYFKRVAMAVVSIMMACVFSFSVVACSSDDNSSDNGDSGTTDNTDTGSSGGSSDTGSSDSGSSGGGESTVSGTYTLNDYTSVSPSNWNILTYTDSNDTQIMEYIHSYFFEFDYDFGGNKYDSNGNILSENIVEGSYEVHYSAATKVEDVTGSVSSSWGYTASQIADGGYAWKITLRDDLSWDDGTAITAADFVYSMKEQLNPDYYNYRADSYYNSSVVIHNARNYLYQGSYAYSNMISANYGDDEYVLTDNLTEEATTGYLKDSDGNYIYIKLSDGGNWGSYGIATYYAAYAESLFANIDYTVLSGAATNSDGYTYVTKDVLSVLNDMIAILHGYANAAAYYAAAGDYAYQEWEEFCYIGANYPDMDFSEVGIYAASDTELVIVLDSPLYLLDDDGGLSYRAAYYLSGLPLVKEDLYEECRVDNSSSGAYDTSTYCSSLATTASWGPYKLTYFQAGKQYILEKNEYWYGWDLEEYQNQYQTEKIICETISDTNTIWESFLIGNLDGVGITADYSEYSSSSYAMFTPSSYTHSLQVQTTYSSSMASNNSAILLNQNFRKAISLGLNRSEFTQATTTASKAGYGILNEMYYYAVDDGLTYRGSNAAKEAILETYGFYLDSTSGYWTDGTNVYASLQDAYDAVTGYDLAQAQALVKTAIEEMKAGTTDYSMYTWYTDGTYSASDIVWDSTKNVTIQIVVSDSSSTTYTLMLEYLQSYIDAITAGTELEGKITLEYTDQGSDWSTNFRAGTGELCMGGWSGAAWDPGYMLLAYLDSSYMYSYSWDTSSQMLTLTMPDGDYTEAGQTLTMSLYDWYLCLNGTSTSYSYNWASGNVDDDVRLFLIAALEKEILEMYYSIPIYYTYSASLHSAKINYIADEYNTFMSYGGIRYITYNYTDDEWTTFVSSQGGDLTSLYKG